MGAACCKMKEEEMVYKTNIVDSAVQYDFRDSMMESAIPPREIEPKIQMQFAQVNPILLIENESSMDNINIESEEPSHFNEELMVESSGKVCERKEYSQVSHKQQNLMDEKECCAGYFQLQGAASLAIEKSSSRIPQLEENYSKTERKIEIDETIIFESELEKYRPGMRVHSIKKWLQVTKFHLKYFKNRYTSSVLNKPLVIIPLSQIKDVKRVNETTNQEKIVKPLFQFEIFLKEFDPEAEQRKPSELPSLPKNEEQKNDVIIDTDIRDINKVDVRSIIRSKSEEIISEKNKDLAQEAQFTPRIRTREFDFYIDNIFKSDLATPIKENEIINPELPDPNCQLCSSKPDSPDSPKPEEKKITFPYKLMESLKFENETEEEQFLIYAKNHKPRLLRKKALEKAFSKNSSNLFRTHANTNTWTHRKKMWNTADKRLLFSTESKELCDTWIILLNWLISRLE